MLKDKKLKLAIDNNIGLYQAVFDGHDVMLLSNLDIAYTLSKKIPPFYSHLVT